MKPETLETRLLKRIDRKRGDVFLRADFDDLGGYDQVGRALRQLVREGRLVRVGQGLYARARPSMTNGEPVPVGGLTALKEALRRVGVETLPSRLEQAYNAGRTTQVPTGRVVGVTRRVRRKIGYGGINLSFSSVLDPRLVERVAEDLGTSPGLVEKDWHVVRALGVIAQVEPGGMALAFSGGTSLSKGWELIKRFSEDIDFKVAEPPAASLAAGQRARSDYRRRLFYELTGAGFALEGAPGVRNDSRFFGADLAYGALFGAGQGLRPHIRIEVSFRAPAVAPVARPIRSLIAAAAREPAEVAAFSCIDIVETAADKLSALAWRVRVRRRGEPKDDPTIIRHLHDLAALEAAVATAPNFRELVLAAVTADIGRGGEKDPPTNPAIIFAGMLQRLETDPLWAREYEDFVRAVSFAGPDEMIAFADALASCRRLAGAAGAG